MKKRPLGVWLVCGYFVLVAVTPTLFIARLYFLDTLGAELALQYYEELSYWEWLPLVADCVLGVACIYALFTLNKFALPLVVGIFLIGLVQPMIDAYTWLTIDQYAHIVDTTGVAIRLVFGWLLAVSIVYYVWRLTKSGVLV